MRVAKLAYRRDHRERKNASENQVVCPLVCPLCGDDVMMMSDSHWITLTVSVEKNAARDDA